MSIQTIECSIEIPSSILQQEVWTIEEKLKEIEGVEVDLQEPKDMATTATLMLHIVISITGALTIVAGGIKSVYEVAKILYDFLHHSNDKSTDSEIAKRKTVIRRKGTKLELYNLSIEDIEKILEDLQKK